MLLDEIYANLADDGPRLVYADHLQLAGDPRGELIAVQCELARHGFAHRSPSHDWIGDGLGDWDVDPGHIKKLRARETALLAAHGSEWLEPAKLGFSRAPDHYFRFARGFVERVQFTAVLPTVAQELAQIAAAIPTLEAFEFITLSRDEPARPFAWTAIGSLRSLTMPSFGARGLVTLQRSTLRELVLYGDGEVRPLFDWKPFAELRVVELNGQGLTTADATKLLAAAGPLEELQLRQSKLGPAGAKAIAGTARSLRVLSLMANAIGPDGTKALAEQLAELRALDLRKNKIGVVGAEALGRNCHRLRTLDLTGNSLGVRGIEALTSGDGLGDLRELCLQQTLLDDDAIVALASSPFLERLRVLSLRSNKITDVGARALARSPHAINLRNLNLNNNKITPAGKKHLDSSEHLEHARIAVR